MNKKVMIRKECYFAAKNNTYNKLSFFSSYIIDFMECHSITKF